MSSNGSLESRPGFTSLNLIEGDPDALTHIRPGSNVDSPLELEFVPNQSLCNDCKRCCHEGEYDQYMLLHNSYKALKKSSQECQLCYMVYNGLQPPASSAQQSLIGGCKFDVLKKKHQTQIWIIKRLRDIDVNVFDEPLSFLEVIMTAEMLGGQQNRYQQIGYDRQCRPPNYIWGLHQATNNHIRRGRLGSACLSKLEASEHSTESFFDVLPTEHKYDGITTAFRHRNMFTRWMLIRFQAQSGAYHRAVLNVRTVRDLELQHFPSPEVSKTTFDTISCRLQLAKHWLAMCLENHDTCKEWSGSCSTLPTRVIDVGTDNIDQTKHPVLYLSQPEEQGAYLALSHRWGNQNLKTEKNSLQQHRHAISIDGTMPQTFKDAIQITRYLGYRYLWIDSLCIIQDDTEDWEAESKKMGSIFRNAVCTIVAATTTEDISGCFSKSTNISERTWLPCELGTIKIPCKNKPPCQDQHMEDGKYNIKIFASPSPASLQVSNEGKEVRPKEPLDKRGWVLQEEVLSGRMLIFSSQGLVWECTTSISTEARPEGVPWHYTAEALRMRPGNTGLIETHYSRRFRNFISDRPDHFDKELRKERRRGPFYHAGARRGDLLSIWHQIVEDYSARQLTKEDDRLIAIQGLINTIKRKHSDMECIAGLWLDDFESELLWQVVNTESMATPRCECVSSFAKNDSREVPLERREKYDHESGTIPSWSWAQVNQRVIFPQIQPRDDRGSYITFRKPNLTDRNGIAVKDGIMVGPLPALGKMRVVYAKTISPKGQQIRTSSSVKGGVLRTSTIIANHKFPIESKINQFYPDYPNWAPVKLMVCVPISDGYRRDLRGRNSERVLFCLILEPTKECKLINQSSNDLQFKRIGLATLGMEWAEYLHCSSSKKNYDIEFSIV